MYTIKQTPEDFFVEEIPNFKILKDSGKYAYFMIEKKNWNTNDLIKEIARRLKLKVTNFNVAGLKDKNAITKQYFSVFGVKKEKFDDLRVKDVRFKFIGYGDERIKLGQMRGNLFKIVVRDLDRKLAKIHFLENYFDDQRFSGKNHIIGECLIKKNFSEACKLLDIKVEGKDYVNEIRSIGVRKLRFYVNAYQSYLFNKALYVYFGKKYEKYKTSDTNLGEVIFSGDKIANVKVPIIGFLTELKGEFGEIYKGILFEEKLTEESFLIKELPEISSEGTERDLIVRVKELKITYLDENTAEVSFELPKGSYGTLVIRKMYALG
ncbi:MAG: tRNA pseudouridine(13) synthase TruD [Candidatus Nanoarchaeia archaeon]|nr:tRNA pseudouridine(13) synthase TruD [Candidatus Nanoarchaeia archaeon]